MVTEILWVCVWTLTSVKTELFPGWLCVCGARPRETMEVGEAAGEEASALWQIALPWVMALPPGCP